MSPRKSITLKYLVMDYSIKSNCNETKIQYATSVLKMDVPTPKPKILLTVRASTSLSTAGSPCHDLPSVLVSR